MKLKTLKDMDKAGCEICVDGVRKISVPKLKQEAIKWVKEDVHSIHIPDFEGNIQNARSYANTPQIPNGTLTKHFPFNNATKEWVKHFFNITEEDLK